MTCIGCGSPSGYSSDSCVLAFRCLHGTAPTYLAESLQQTTAVEARRQSSPVFSRHPVADRSTHTTINSWRPLVSHSSGKIVESPTRFHSERLVCRHLPPSSEESSVLVQLLYQLDLLLSVISVTLTFSSTFRLVLSVSVDHRLCKVPLQCIH